MLVVVVCIVLDSFSPRRPISLVRRVGAATQERLVGSQAIKRGSLLRTTGYRKRWVDCILLWTDIPPIILPS